MPVQPQAPAPTFSVVGSDAEPGYDADHAAHAQNPSVDVPPRMYDEEPARRKVEELDVPDFLK